MVNAGPPTTAAPSTAAPTTAAPTTAAPSTAAPTTAAPTTTAKPRTKKYQAFVALSNLHDVPVEKVPQIASGYGGRLRDHGISQVL